eukprot:46-Heterococcus_DN1.PRE.1
MKNNRFLKRTIRMNRLANRLDCTAVPQSFCCFSSSVLVHYCIQSVAGAICSVCACCCQSQLFLKCSKTVLYCSATNISYCKNANHDSTSIAVV